jgi:hypothetical protein
MPSDESERKTAVRVASDSFYELCKAFRASSKFEALAPATQALWAREFKFACAPNCVGDVSLTEIRPADLLAGEIAIEHLLTCKDVKLSSFVVVSCGDVPRRICPILPA